MPPEAVGLGERVVLAPLNPRELGEALGHLELVGTASAHGISPQVGHDLKPHLVQLVKSS